VEQALPWHISSPRRRCLPSGQLAGSMIAHVSPQHSEAEHTPPLQPWPSSWSRAICPDGHWCDPLESPLSRQPDIQHRTEQQSLATQASPLHMCSSCWLRAICPAAHSCDPLESPLSRQPDIQHRAEQHSEAEHTPPLQPWPSSWPRAICPDGHWCDPLESPLSRQPDIQHRVEQQSLAEQPSPLQPWPSSWPRAICPDGHRIVPSSTAAVESRKPVAQHDVLGDDDSAKATSGSIFSLPVACPLAFFSRRTFRFRRKRYVLSLLLVL